MSTLLSYTLTIINDEEQVALAAGPAGTTGFNHMAVVSAVIAAFIVFAAIAYTYINTCMRYRKSYVQLYTARTGKAPEVLSWNVNALKDMIREEEATEADILLTSSGMEIPPIAS